MKLVFYRSAKNNSNFLTVIQRIPSSFKLSSMGRVLLKKKKALPLHVIREGRVISHPLKDADNDFDHVLNVHGLNLFLRLKVHFGPPFHYLYGSGFIEKIAHLVSSRAKSNQ